MKKVLMACLPSRIINLLRHISNAKRYILFIRYFERGGALTFLPRDNILGILELKNTEIAFVRCFEMFRRGVRKVLGISHKSIGLNLTDEQKRVIYKFQAKMPSLLPEQCVRLFDAAQKQGLHFSAQYAQDVLAYLFYGGKKEGFYIEIGANDGYGGSTTYWAKQIGWRGICVEPEKTTFNDMMADFPEVKHIDFMSIDTEGLGMNVLQSIDFNKYSFGFIAIENEENSDVTKYLEQNGYKPLLVAGSNVILLPKTYETRLNCCVWPFTGSNKYLDQIKAALSSVGITPVSEENMEVADFVWYHWIENYYEKPDILSNVKKLTDMGKKIIWNLHNRIPHETGDVRKVRAFMSDMADIAYKIIIHCNESMQVVKDICGENTPNLSKVVYVPHPCYIGVYEGNSSIKNTIDNNILKLCFFGMIRKYKNIELLISVIKELNYSDVELEITGVGDLKYIQTLNKLIGGHSSIKKKIKSVDDQEIPEILANSHLLILPYNLNSSLNSSVTLLAFSYGRSVISPITGTLSDIGDKSLLFAYKYKNENDHKDALKKQITAIREKYKGNYNELLKLGEKCRLYMSENNSLEIVAGRLRQVFLA